ncbi:hotdog domain-containing protein [Streptomyces sp. NPDC004959]|uniref:acyl-CoA thioesterase n=1 Tax=unclassified Streptomyces TaxID=2593676 RepID=UPI0004C62DF3|nr:hotdog domain-containing protein [Streptomyces sp. NRRL F-5630]
MSLAAPAPAETGPPPYGVLVPSYVHFDDLDALGLLHNGRYPLLVERAWTAYWRTHGLAYRGDWHEAADACNAVREFTIGYEHPVTLTGEYAVHLWLDRLGTTGLTYGFRYCSADGTVTYARGHRVLVRLDPDTLRPRPWSEDFRAKARGLLRVA